MTPSAPLPAASFNHTKLLRSASELFEISGFYLDAQSRYSKRINKCAYVKVYVVIYIYTYIDRERGWGLKV